MAFDGRVAIVTGAGAELGRAHALFLARHGARVVVSDIDPVASQCVAEEIRASGCEALGVPASVTDEAAVGAMVDQVMTAWGRIDILINNAGILRDKSFAKMSLDDFRTVLDVHLMGAVICTKAVWEIMRAQAYGRIVMTTSSSGLYGNFGQANYGAAKMALVGLMQTLAIEGAKYDIRVNCLAPTAATQMTAGIVSETEPGALDPLLVSPALFILAGADAPTRVILCSGAGHFAAAHVSLTTGIFIGSGNDAGDRLVKHWQAVTDRAGDIVPDYGFKQVERELLSAQTSTRS